MNMLINSVINDKNLNKAFPMKNKLIFTSVAFLLTICVSAQDEANMENFLKKYFSSGTIMIKDPYEYQKNKPMPEFYFNDSLNSKVLKGRVIVLDFWATWCGGCMIVSKGLNTLIAKDSVYRDVQIIGVNRNEKMVNKGYNASEYWKESGKVFPMVIGPAADSCGASVSNGWPTVIVVDDDGILRDRWDGAGPSTANAIKGKVWKYAVWPKVKELPLTVENAKKLFKKGDWISTLYFLESLPKSEEASILKFETLLHISEKHAHSYAVGLKEELMKSSEYKNLVFRMAKDIVEIETTNIGLIKMGLQICEELIKDKSYRHNNDLDIFQAQLHWQYAEYEKQVARDMIYNKLYNNEFNPEADQAMVKRLKDLQKKYQEAD